MEPKFSVDIDTVGWGQLTENHAQKYTCSVQYLFPLAWPCPSPPALLLIPGFSLDQTVIWIPQFHPQYALLDMCLLLTLLSFPLLVMSLDPNPSWGYWTMSSVHLTVVSIVVVEIPVKGRRFPMEWLFTSTVLSRCYKILESFWPHYSQETKAFGKRANHFCGLRMCHLPKCYDPSSIPSMTDLDFLAH